MGRIIFRILKNKYQNKSQLMNEQTKFKSEIYKHIQTFMEEYKKQLKQIKLKWKVTNIIIYQMKMAKRLYTPYTFTVLNITFLSIYSTICFVLFITCKL